MHNPGSFYKYHLTPKNLDREIIFNKAINELAKEFEIKFIPIFDDKMLIDRDDINNLITLSKEEIQFDSTLNIQPIFLGKTANEVFYAVSINEVLLNKIDIEPKDFSEFRWLGPLMDSDVCALLTYAKSLIYWQVNNQFCGTCGSGTRVINYGASIKCTNLECGKQKFPNTDPAVIVLVQKENKALLGRQPRWPDRMYSTLAGFVEPGERIEDTVRREVFEESGIRVENIRYYDSQPWPFPASLMLGFFADAENWDINIEDDELSDAQWLSRREIKERIEDGSLRLPSKISIAYRLIEEWFNQGEYSDLHTYIKE